MAVGSTGEPPRRSGTSPATSLRAPAPILSYLIIGSSPEHPFPAAVQELEECYRGLVDQGAAKISLTGDSAGGNLALVLLSIASAQASEGFVAPAGAVVFLSDN